MEWREIMGIKFIGDPTPEELEDLKRECMEIGIDFESVEFMPSFDGSQVLLNIMIFILQIRFIIYYFKTF
jgi:hypothetical protein